MYRICKECKKKLTFQDYVYIEQINWRYEKLSNSRLVWGCIDAPFEITLDDQKIKIPYKEHIVDNEELRNGAH